MNDYIDDKRIESMYLFYYGFHESEYLAKPEDYSCSAAGLMIVKWEGFIK